MRTAVANEDSVVEDGQPIALPYAPALSTRNTVIAAGSAVQVSTSGSDTLIWPQQATPQGNTVVIPAGSSLTFFYSGGTWYIVAEGSVPGADTVTSYNTRVGAVTSQLTDVTSLFTAAGQLIAGTVGSGKLLSPGAAGTVLSVGGPDSTGLQWISPAAAGAGVSFNATYGAPTTGTWQAGQVVIDSSGVQWVCTVAGTPGTWIPVGPQTGDYKEAALNTTLGGWLFCDGTAYSRTTYAALFAALAWSTTGTTTSSGATITAVSSAIVSLLSPGMTVTITNSNGGTGFTVTNATSNGTNVTFTASNNLTLGQTVTFSGFSVASGLSSLNEGVYTTTTVSGSSFQIASTLTASGTPTATGSSIYTVSSASGTSVVLTFGTGISAHTAGAIVIYSVGAGNGTTTFQVPDRRGLVGVGTGAVGTNSQPTVILGQNTANSTAGETTHVLLEAELASHNHTGSTSIDLSNHTHNYSTTTGYENTAHTHNFPASNIVNYEGPGGGNVGGTGNNMFGIVGMQTSSEQENHGHSVSDTTAGINQNHEHSVSSDGSSAAHNNIQPMIGVGVFIKT
jgi:microcystin-dependent protein